VVPRKSRLGRVDGVAIVAFRVSKEEREALAGAAGALKVNEFARRRALAGIVVRPAPAPPPGPELRVEYDEGEP